ncbi:hypothetical protein [Ensifer adhaerens]|uniref:Uncharacterized protein n=1 Tax=Ensifer adhaerens TaxID=106592 RepID=A0ABY8HGU5_ENSAD|nr:hypothetical protein [Ensifer adhaerens]WFP91351.1 hypothetical protein P4B07_02935 [Ensifer adhaerens]
MSDELDRLMWEINDAFDEFHRGISDGLRINWMPTGPGFRLRDLERYEAFLESSPAEQAEFLKTVHSDELKFWHELQSARAAYLADQPT